MDVKPTHKAIKNYHETLEQFEGQQIHHELAVRSAFQTLLADTPALEMALGYPTSNVGALVRSYLVA